MVLLSVGVLDIYADPWWRIRKSFRLEL